MGRRRWIAVGRCFRRQGAGPAGGWSGIGWSMSDEAGGDQKSRVMWE